MKTNLFAIVLPSGEKCGLAVILSRLKRGTGVGLFLVFVLFGCSDKESEGFEFQLIGTTMGTTFSVKVPKLPKTIDADSLKSEINNTLVTLNSILSTYLVDSDLSRLNRNRSAEWIPISQQLAEVLEEALVVSELTNGAYDVTVGSLVNLWGFGPGEFKQSVPDLADIKALREIGGFGKVHLNFQKKAVRKDHPEIYIDLSSLAKGYGVDQIADLLSGYGIENYLVEIGGELRVHGTKSKGEYWKIAIEKPEAGKRLIEQTIEMKNVAIATSGDYRNFFEVDGIRYSHTIDPRTGLPISHKLASVTVLDNSSMRADALATALMVLGPDAGFRLAQEHKISALFIKKVGKGFAKLSSSTFRSENE